MSDAKLKTKMVTSADEKIRGSYVNIFQARKNDLNGKMEYSMQLLIPKESKKTLASIKKVSQAALTNKFGDNIPKNCRKALRDGDEPDDDGNPMRAEYLGHYYVNVKNSRAPGIVDQSRQPLLEASELISGDYVRVSLNAYGYNEKGNKGVALGLNNVQLVSKGDPLDGSTTAEEDFDELEDDDGLDGIFDDDE